MASPSEELRRFPRIFGVYRVFNRSRNLIIARPGANTPSLYVVTRAHIGGRCEYAPCPHVRLHAAPFSNSSIMGMVHCRMPPESWKILIAEDQLPDYSLQDPSRLPRGTIGATRTVRLRIRHAFHSTREFAFKSLDGNDEMEEFIWKDSRGAEVRALGGSRAGMKLVRVSTKEVLAAWTTPATEGGRLKGIMRFCGQQRFSEDFELAVVMTLIAMVNSESKPLVEFAGLNLRQPLDML